MRKCVLNEFNISTYPWNVSIAKSVVCTEPDGCGKFNRSSICVKEEAEKLSKDVRDNFTSIFTVTLNYVIDQLINHTYFSDLSQGGIKRNKEL